MKDLERISDEKLWSLIPSKNGVKRLEILLELSLRAFWSGQYQHSLTICEAVLDQVDLDSFSDRIRIAVSASLGAAHSARALGNHPLQNSFISNALQINLKFQNQIQIDILETMINWSSTKEDYQSANKWVDTAIIENDNPQFVIQLSKLKSQCLVEIKSLPEAINLLQSTLSNPALTDEKLSMRIELLELLAKSLLMSGQAKIALDTIRVIDTLTEPYRDFNETEYSKLRSKILVENGLIKQALDYLLEYISRPEYKKIKERDAADIDEILFDIAIKTKDSKLTAKINLRICAREKKNCKKFSTDIHPLTFADTDKENKQGQLSISDQQNVDAFLNSITTPKTKEGNK